MAGNRIKGITVEIGGDTTKLQTALKGVNTEIRNTQSQLKDVEKLLPVTGVVTGLGTAAVKTAADFDFAMSKVAAVSGATGSDFDSLRDKAREMGAKTKFSVTEAADAINYMAMAGWKTEDMLSGIEGVMYLAAASGVSNFYVTNITVCAIIKMI